jgi:hypothetical protein
MSTPNIEALKKTADAVLEIKNRLKPVIEKLNDDDFEKNTSQAQATVALSIGMLKYIGGRLQGKDKGRKPDDPLRKELNNMKRVLAELKKKNASKKSQSSLPPPTPKGEKIEQSGQIIKANDNIQSVSKSASAAKGKDERAKKRKGPDSNKRSRKRR